MSQMFGPDVTFLGCDRVDLEHGDLGAHDVVIIGAPYDSGTSYRSGARFGPMAIRTTDYLAHDAVRPHLSAGVDPFEVLRIADAGDVMMTPDQRESAFGALERAVRRIRAAGAFPLVLGGDHSIALPDVTAVAREIGWGRVGLVHFDAHADTGDSDFGSLHGHGQPMRRLIESGAARGDRFLQIGLRGYWPGPETLEWMAGEGMRWYDMGEITERGLDDCLTEAFATATDDCDGVFLSVDIDVADPAAAPATGTPEPGGLTARALLDAVRRCATELPLVGMDLVEVAPAYDHADTTVLLANRVVLEALTGLALASGGRLNAG